MINIKLYLFLYLIVHSVFVNAQSAEDSLADKFVFTKSYFFYRTPDTIKCEIHFSVNPKSSVVMEYYRIGSGIWVLYNINGNVIEIGKFKRASLFSRIVRNDHSLYKNQTWVYFDEKGKIKETYTYRGRNLCSDPKNFHSLKEYKIIKYNNYPAKPIRR